jgi:hypothetical protein
MNGLGLASGVAIAAGSLALHSDTLIYWIGPAGCIILIPALVLVLALPLLRTGRPVASGWSSGREEIDSPARPALPGSAVLANALQTAAQIHISAEVTADGSHRQSITITHRYPGEPPVHRATPVPDHAKHPALARSRAMIGHE